MAGPGAASTSLKEYLKRYESSSVEEENKKKKKKKKKSRPDAPSGVLVVDEDPVWRKPVILEEEGESSPDEKPTVDEDIEVKRMRRLELIKARRAQNPIAEDGSGWVTLGRERENTPDGNADISPPRKRRITNDTPLSEPGVEHLDSLVAATDLSPPRQRPVRGERGLPDMSPPRRRHRSSPDQVMDFSPPRKSSRDVKRPGLDDLSPSLKSSREVKRGGSDDISPPRKRNSDARRTGFDDLSSPRSRSHLPNGGGPRGSVDQDISPPRRNRNELVASASSKEQPKTGLISGHDMRDEVLRTRKEDLLRFEQMDPSVSGRGAAAVYRDKKGNRISKDEYFKVNQKVEEKPKEIKIEWGKGLAQKREAEAKLLELELEKEKPFARTRDDAELDAMLKERVRWGDPMAHLVKKKHSETVLPDLGDNEKMKESGFIIPQEIPSHSWIRRGLDAAPNRYGIRPGRHWDGVDRSNGFEKQAFKRMNEKQATEREAYLWSVSDM